MKVLFVIDDLVSGGAQRHMVNLAFCYKDDGHEVSVLTYYPRDFYKPILENYGIATTCLPIDNPIKRIFAIRIFIRKGNFDLVQGYSGIPNFLCELAAFPTKKWKLVVNEQSTNPAILKSPKSIFIRYFHFFADAVVSNSYANRELVTKVNPFLPKNKLHVIYNMANLDEWKPSDGFTFKSNGKLNLTIVATHRRLKNFKGLLEALHLLSESEKQQISVNWIGNGLEEPYYDSSISECRDLMKKNNLEGIVNLLPSNYTERALIAEVQKADLIGLFSFFEGLPNAVCEGMCLGKPILAAAVSDVPLLVEEDVNGKLLNPNDINTIVLGLRFFINASSEQLTKMGKKSHEKAVNLFDQNYIFQRYIDLFQ